MKFTPGKQRGSSFAHSGPVEQFSEEWRTMWHTAGRSQRQHGHVLWMANRLVKRGQAASRAGDKNRSLDLQIVYNQARRVADACSTMFGFTWHITLGCGGDC